jgi:hypothetical protein
MTTNYDDDPERLFGRFLTCTIGLIFALLLLIILSSCSPRVITEIHYQHDTTYIQQIQIDSVYKRDSIYIKDKGDTVWIYKELWREKYKYLRDTVSIVRVDSVAVEKEKIIQVEKPLSKWKSWQLAAFPWLLGLLGIAGLWTFRKPLLKLIRKF